MDIPPALEDALKHVQVNNNTQTGEYEYDSGEMAWLLATTGFVWIIIPGVGFLYSGMAKSSSSLSLIMICLWSCAVISIQWYLIGFSLCLTNTSGPYIGNLDHVFLWNADFPFEANPKVPSLLISIWFCLFAAVTPTIILGAIPERTRFLPTLIFIFVWSTLVFDVLAYWTWNSKGWIHSMGALDFAGGTSVHISTGAAALAFALVVGKREDATEKPPHNMTLVVLGTSFIWLAWIVANAGCGLSPHQRAVTIFIATNLAGSMGGITWGLIDHFKTGKWNPLGFCTGVICGLVSITPASGYVTPTYSLVFGFMGALVCYTYGNCCRSGCIDDTFDVFGCHGVGGIVGNILTGIFAQKSVAAVDGSEIAGGWLDGNWMQPVYQIIDTAAGLAWSFVITALILLILNKIPGLHLRASLRDEREGVDKADLGIQMYEHIDGEFRETLLGPFEFKGLDQVSALKNRNSINK